MRDKGLTEEKDPSANFTRARSLFCWFHVQKIFKLKFLKAEQELLEQLYYSENSTAFETN